MKIRKQLSLLCAALSMSLAPAHGEVTWRVSVKIILGANGQRPGSPPVANSEIDAQFDFANSNPYVVGRGIQLVKTEIVQVTPPASASQDWFNVDLAPKATKTALETEAKANAAYAWRTDAINIYLNDGTPGGAGSFPDSGESIIVIGADKMQGTPWVFLHEIGHFMSLRHTHQGQNCTDDDQSDCDDCPNPQGGNDDLIADTLSDHKCFDQDGIAQESFGSTYAASSSGEREQVDNTFFNIMSYHSNRSILTTLQLDAMCDTSNLDRDIVSHNNFIFVDVLGTSPAPTGSSQSVNILGVPIGGPYQRLTDGIDAADEGDVLLLRPGSYIESSVLRKAITLRAVRRDVLTAGNATIRAR